jgi:hypothetical protein
VETAYIEWAEAMRYRRTTGRWLLDDVAAAADREPGRGAAALRRRVLSAGLSDADRQRLKAIRPPRWRRWPLLGRLRGWPDSAVALQRDVEGFPSADGWLSLCPACGRTTMLVGDGGVAD